MFSIRLTATGKIKTRHHKAGSPLILHPFPTRKRGAIDDEPQIATPDLHAVKLRQLSVAKSQKSQQHSKHSRLAIIRRPFIPGLF